MTFGFHVADHGLDGGSTSQFAFYGVVFRDQDAACILRIMAAVNIGALRSGSGELLGVLDDVPQRVGVVGIARQ